jgi:O-antigen ligase
MSTPRLVARGSLPEPLVLGGLVLAVAAASFAVAYVGTPRLVPLLVLALLGGALVLWRPEIGLFAMLAVLVIKPDAIQGLGIVGPNTLLSVVLAAVLFVGMLSGGQHHDFVKSNQIRAFAAIGLVMALNWALAGRTAAPGSLADLDYTGRALYRYVIHLSLLVFLIAFIRTRQQLLALTALFIVGIVVTVPGALSGASEGAARSVEALRAAAVSGVRSAENANRLAFMCLMGISITWFALQHYRSLLLRLAGSALILVLLFTVFRSGSRSGVLNLLVLGALILIQSRMHPGNFGLVAIVALVSVVGVVMLVPDAVMQRILSPFTADDQPRSVALGDAGRLALLGTSVALAIQNPIMGVGIGNFRWMAYEQSGIAAAAHNAFALAAAEGGILFLGAYLALFWLTARDLGRALRQSRQFPQIGLEWLVLATRANLVLLLVFSLFAEAWKEFYILLILGTAGILAQIYGRAAAEAARRA